MKKIWLAAILLVVGTVMATAEQAKNEQELFPQPPGSHKPFTSVPIGWWETLESFEQLCERGNVQGEVARIFEIATSLNINKSKRVNLPITINGNGCRVTEIKREPVDCPETLPTVNGEVKISCKESIVLIRIEKEGSGTYYEHGVYSTYLQDGDDGFVDFYADIPHDWLVDEDDMRNYALWVCSQTTCAQWLETGDQISSWRDPDDPYFYVYDGVAGEYTYYGYVNTVNEHSIYIVNISGTWRAYAIDESN